MFEESGGREVSEIRENDRVFQLLSEIESKYGKYHLITGSVGMQGALGRETRQVHDLDMCVPRGDSEIVDKFISGLGFNRLPEEAIKKLAGNGMRYIRPDGLGVDVWYGDFTEQGLALPNPYGAVFVPQVGLDFEAKLRGISFKTLTVETHYFFKERATRRHPGKSLTPFNRQQDVSDYQVLRAKVNPDKANRLLEAGLAYTGQHPTLNLRAVEVFIKGRFGKKRLKKY